MQAWKQELSSFWQNHSSSLIQSYPGLNLRRLEQAVQTLYPFQFQSDILPLTNFFLKLKTGMPLQYVEHEAYFYRAPFYVNEHTLIPRSETEMLVEMAIKELKIDPNKRNIIDVGTGSGAILLSVGMEINRPLNLTGVDMSLKALEVAKANYQRLQYSLHPETKLSFFWGDRLQGFFQKFDLILTNPPYIKRNSDWEKVHAKTQEFEPHLALFLNDEEYTEWFTTFLGQIYDSLSASGLCLMEGHEDHLDGIAVIAKKDGFHKVEIVKDYNEQKRILILQK